MLDETGKQLDKRITLEAIGQRSMASIVGRMRMAATGCERRQWK
jgi:hypothetical protein